MGLMICGKCASESTYYQGGGYACMMCGNRSPSRWGFHRKGEQIKPPEPIEEYHGPAFEDEEIEQEEEMNMGKKRTPEQRERIAAGIRAAKERKAAGGGQSKVEKKPKPAEKTREEKIETLKKKIRARLAEKREEKVASSVIAVDKLPDPPDVFMSLTPEDHRHVILDFSLEENKHLLEPWVAYCRKFRRGPGDHAVQLIEETLKAANAL